MAQPQLIQGTWEELSAYAQTLKGRSDLLLIVPGSVEVEKAPPATGISLAEALTGKTGLVSFEPSDLSEDTGKKFAQLLHEAQKEQP